MPELLCGHLAGAWPESAGVNGAGVVGNRSIGCGSRAQGMAGCVTGIALHGGSLPVAVSRLVDMGEQLPALRLAALLRRRAVHLVFDPGMDSPCAAWRPGEVLGWLRGITHLHVFRPGSGIETAECLELAVRRADGPSVVVLGCGVVPEPRDDVGENRCARGGYVLAEAEGPRQATLVATGAELAVAVAAQCVLRAAGMAVAVVSLPCWTLFAAQSEAYRRGVLGEVPRIGLEAGGRTGWDRWLGESGLFIGCEGAEASGPEAALRRCAGLTEGAVAEAVRRRLRSV
jgi:transketolase